MNFSLGGVKRVLLASLATVTLSISLAACSGSDSSSGGDKPSASATTPDPQAADEAAIKKTFDNYWAASTIAENNADPDPKRFAGIFGGSYGERYLKTVRDYRSEGITRTGQAAITNVKVTLHGDTAGILACINEDDWLFKQHGKLLKQPKTGTTPIAASFKRYGENWLLTDFPNAPKDAKC